jgi:RNA 2',3'-cyclic 3'-phosphodiesterase
MARLFFAIPIPTRVQFELHDLETSIPDARWTFGVGLHLTLAFLGDTSRARERDARQIARDIEFAPFELSFDGAGVFPLRNKPQVLWLGVNKCPALIALQKELVIRLRAADFEIERRKFHPHVTLARVGRSPDERIHHWLSHFVGYSSPPFSVNAFHLYESFLKESGPTYTLVDEFLAGQSMSAS